MSNTESYKPEELKTLQRIELEMVKDFNYICEKYDIDYFACGGTGIGALRHGGFIPWDDDIDIGLTRKDMNKFIKFAPLEFPEKYKLLNADLDDNYFCMNTKWMLRGTEFREYGMEDFPGELGIFLDLFCQENIADDKWNRNKQVLGAWFWGKLLILRNVSRPTLYIHGFKAKVTYIICAIVHFLLVLFHISPRFLYKKAQKHARMYENQETKLIGFPFDPFPFTSIYRRSWMYPTKKLPFENEYMRFPHKLEKYLDQRFGNYMELPPEEKRHNHKPYRLDFGKYNDAI